MCSSRLIDIRAASTSFFSLLMLAFRSAISCHCQQCSLISQFTSFTIMFQPLCLPGLLSRASRHPQIQRPHIRQVLSTPSPPQNPILLCAIFITSTLHFPQSQLIRAFPDSCSGKIIINGAKSEAETLDSARMYQAQATHGVSRMFHDA